MLGAILRTGASLVGARMYARQERKADAHFEYTDMLTLVCYSNTILLMAECAFLRVNADTILTNFSTKYIVICKVYTDVGGIK